MRWQAAPGAVLPPNLREQLAGPIVLPSAYLRRAVASFQVRGRPQQGTRCQTRSPRHVVRRARTVARQQALTWTSPPPRPSASHGMPQHAVGHTAEMGPAAAAVPPRQSWVIPGR